MASSTNAAHRREIGKEAFIASIGGQRAYADWTNPRHRARRLMSEAIGVGGLTFILSGGAAIITRWGGPAGGWQLALVLSAVSGLWLMVAVFFLGDISAHFDPAVTFAFALRGDIGWIMALFYWLVQAVAACAGSLLARFFAGDGGNLAATRPQPGMEWQAAAFEAVLTCGLVLLVLNMANGPKLNGPFVPLAVGGYIIAWGTMGGPFQGASMNPARSLGPAVATGDFTGYWAYVVGPVAGALIAVGIARILRGPASASEAQAAQGIPLERHPEEQG